MKKFLAFLLLISAPLMAQHATQFAYYSTSICQAVDSPTSSGSSQSNESQESSPPSNPYSAIIWDPDTQVSTEGISLEGNGINFNDCELIEITGPNTIHIHHAGWYFAKFLIFGGTEPNTPGVFNFGLLNVDDLTIIPFSVYGIIADNTPFDQLAGQVVFYAPADTRIQLVNEGLLGITVNSNDSSNSFLTSIYLVELLGR